MRERRPRVVYTTNKPQQSQIDETKHTMLPRSRNAVSGAVQLGRSCIRVVAVWWLVLLLFFSAIRVFRRQYDFMNHERWYPYLDAEWKAATDAECQTNVGVVALCIELWEICCIALTSSLAVALQSVLRTTQKYPQTPLDTQLQRRLQLRHKIGFRQLFALVITLCCPSWAQRICSALLKGCLLYTSDAADE